MWKIIFLTVAIIATITLYPVLDMDEAWYSSVSLRMAKTGNWLIPNFNGEIFPTKPPLWFWITGGIFKLFGESEWGARIGSLIFTLLTAYLLYIWGERRKVEAHLIYLSSLLPVLIACVGRMDAPMVFFLTLAFFLGHRRRWTLAGISLGLGILSKGPVVLIIWGVSFLIYSILYDRKALKGIVLSGFLSILVGGSWFALLYLKGMEDVVKHFLLHENIERVKTGLEGHTGPLYYYIPVLLLGVIPNMGRLFKSLSYWNEENALFYIWFLTTMVMFTIAQTKLPHYILPAFPALALMMEREREGLIDWLSGGILILIPLFIMYYFKENLPGELKRGLFMSIFAILAVWGLSFYFKDLRRLISSLFALSLAILVLNPFKNFYPHYQAGLFAKEKGIELTAKREALAPSTVFYYGRDIPVNKEGKWILSYENEIKGYKVIFESEGFSLYNGKWVKLRIFEKQ
ncbi:MAG: glycosyltransferase family 39 protein [Synergistetes bacterium]|nr:glycosyltransferase family 39 protein [Synergistota bacterium]MDW8191615.1 glycosyltransferase family 39 protein [Synergistota bacterium]